MKKRITRQLLERMLDDYAGDIPGLREMLEENIRKDYEIIEPEESGLERIVLDSVPEALNIGDNAIQSERIIIVEKGGRPVAKVFNNKITDEFLGENKDFNPWRDRLSTASKMLNEWIPAIGRIELKDGEIPWGGTGWLIDDDIIVTNRHVAELFAQLDEQNSRFVFKPGVLNHQMSSGIDFLQEENNERIDEHPITEILYIAHEDESDVAFLRVKQASEDRPLPKKIALAAENEIKKGSTIVAIGYPAKDPSIRDQALVARIFGDGVYDKKRVSPGRLTRVEEELIRHDCSTLGGNSGSVLIDLETGKAVGLHQGGFLDDSSNIGVNIRHVKKLLDKVKGNFVDESKKDQNDNVTALINGGELKLRGNVPVEINIRIGQAGDISIQLSSNSSSSLIGDIDSALKTAREMVAASRSQYAHVTGVRKGYRFKNGWITDEKVIVFEVDEKLEHSDLLGTGQKLLPREINGIGVDVRVASKPDEIDKLIESSLIVVERKAKAAGYVEPTGFDKKNSGFFLDRVVARMDAIFHVSPDAGFKELSEFISRTKTKLTATIYEWDKNHISDVIENVMSEDGRSLKMVTQHRGVGGKIATITAVEDMLSRIPDKFEHVYASTRGPERLIPNSYHIKVASRDGEEFWLSSGNWKNSNQPENPTEFQSLIDFNREWHAIIKNEKLAKLFRNYIDFDFEQATLFPLDTGESVQMPDMEFFVPDTRIRTERLGGVTYEDTLRIENEVLDIQPLLTPDRDPAGGRIFMNHLIDMIRRATKSIYIQNQSFSFTDDNNEEFDELFEEIRLKQRSIRDVRIIIRDAHDFGRPKDLENQQKLLERLKANGLSTSRRKLRLQSRCHTKGVIIDSKEVLLGSQNLTNGGSLVNRDASLLIRNEKVAKFYEKIFLFDWDNLTHNQVNENVPPIQRAAPGEATPAGFKRVTLGELVGERM